MTDEDKVLVTGSNGQLGQCFMEEIKYHCLKDNFIFTTRKEFDITNYQMMENYLNEHSDIKVIINCAAYTDVKRCETYEGWKDAEAVNIIGVENLAKITEERNIFLVHFGTDYIYASKEKVNTPIKETMINRKLENYEREELNLYALSKLIGINKLIDIKLSGKYVVIITSWLYSEYGHNFVKTIYNRIIDNKYTNVVCNQIGSPTYAGDLVKYVLKNVIEYNCKFYNKNCGNGYDEHIINFSNLGSASWYDIANFIQFIMEKNWKENHKNTYETPPEYVNYDLIYPIFNNIDNVKRPNYSVLSLEKLIDYEGYGEYIRNWQNALEYCIINIHI